MRLVFIGAPGAGKGTVADVICRETGMIHISTGDLLRENVANGTELGQQIKDVLSSGNLVDDSIIVRLLRNKFLEDDIKKGYILDGFPRDQMQALALMTFATVDFVVNLTVSDDVAVNRIMHRGLTSNRSDDDNEDAIRHRIEVYHSQTLPLIEFYTDRKLLINVDANTDTPQQIADKIIEITGM